jgi:hypothetical protein
MSSWELATTLLGGIATLAIFSFLWKENVVYRFFEHVFIGIAAGFGITGTIQRFLWPKVLSPMLGFDVLQYPDGTYAQSYQPAYLLYVLPMVFGLLYYFIYSKRYMWLAKMVIGFSLGIGGGLSFKAFFNETLPQLSSSFKPLVVYTDEKFNIWLSVSNIIFVFTLLAVMFYFFFSLRQSSAAARKFSASGRFLLMLCFGAFFGSTVMARMALLVERLQFLFFDWVSALKALFS